MIVRLSLIFTALVLGILAVIATHGAFDTIVITERVAGPYEFVYRTAPHGNFRAVRRITTELENSFQAAGIRDIKPLDIYFPAGSSESTQIGFVVAATDLDRIAKLPHPPLHRTIPAQAFLTTSIRYTSPISFMIGSLKVAPRLDEYRAANGLKQTWAATINEGRTILYLQPIEASGPGSGS